MFSNRKIRELNKKQNPFPDYLKNDLWACVASFAVIEKNILYYGYVCDCGLAVFDKNGKLKFKTKDEGLSKIDKFIWPEIKKELSKKLNKKEHEINWRLPEARKEQRFKYRNNPRKKYSYGAFTGEKMFLFT